MNKNYELEAKERINFFLNVLKTTMVSCNMKIGFDLKEKQFVVQDIETELFSRIKLEELNNF
ncbi:hypothetical protein FDC58_09870 [Clostridium botulinum]|uniref:hypothetical protein n=1 Tax=unclassified Clostridium TaxID=2614128 RepID=UPI0013CCB0B6|nr:MULTISPECIES: hypothetical protein [unclassified Clostridium]MBY7008501.1 hypothetical protein [Clostridium botulinum]NFH73134.1 hypothetical protein [Clostridium botulinum]NFI82508.1 hypothetical protein [Clostridium botulinum]NFJ72286.1 hypothetical protein [Clostridium botulinum]NFK66510.1 hypothetical protein [Clostridium botulinum]